MNPLVSQAATVATTYLVSGQFPRTTDGATNALSRALTACGLVLTSMQRAQATGVALRQSGPAC
jgi:hypothetical protein